VVGYNPNERGDYGIRRRAKVKARDLGARFFREASNDTKRHLYELVAIVHDAKADPKAYRGIIRSMVDGVIDAIKRNGAPPLKKKRHKKRKG
jgi:hypothetical protein